MTPGGTTSNGVTTTTSEACKLRLSGSTSDTSTEMSKKPPFGCGCGKCTFFSFLERGCPTPIPSASSFPYLDLSGLTHEQQQELKGRLLFESRQIILQFQGLVSTSINSLIRQNISQDKLVSHIMLLGTFDPVYKKPQVPVFHDRFLELRAADSIPKVFMVLKDYFSFFNYDIIEHIINRLGTDEDKSELQKYKDYFGHYAKRRIFECPPEFGTVIDTDHVDLFVKVDSQYENYTVEEVHVFRHKLSDILSLSSRGVLRLCRVEKGCIQLTFQVPSFVQQMFPLSREQENALAVEGVIKLICGEYQFPDNEDSAEKPQLCISTRGMMYMQLHLSKLTHVYITLLQVMEKLQNHCKTNYNLILTPNLMVRVWLTSNLLVNFHLDRLIPH